MYIASKKRKETKRKDGNEVLAMLSSSATVCQ
jgi:hypothetical protein